METTQPLVLVDIDGVLNAFAGWVTQRDPDIVRQIGFDPQTRKVAPLGYRADRAAGYSLLLHEEHPTWLAKIEQAGAEMMWSTMWVDAAAKHFAPVAGFGHHWDYIDFHAHHSAGAWRNAGMTGHGVGGYKHPGIDEISGTRPVVVIDDDLSEINYRWAERRNGLGWPTLLIQPDPAVGLTADEAEQILAFVAEYAATGYVTSL